MIAFEIAEEAALWKKTVAFRAPGVPGSSERSQVFTLGITVRSTVSQGSCSVAVRRSPGFPLAMVSVQKLK